jgi:hypothetical protein
MKSSSVLIGLLKLVCIIGEVVACITLLAAVILIPISKSLVSSHQASVGVFVTNGSLDWGFYSPLSHGGAFRYHSSEGVVVGGNVPSESPKLPASQSGLGTLSIGPFRIKDVSDPTSLPQVVVGANGVVQQPLSEALTFTEDQDVILLWNSIKWPFGIAVLCASGAGLIILELLRRMLRRVGSGEAFSSRNIQAMRRIAFTLIASAFLKAVALGWLIGSMGNYAIQHTEKFTFAVTSGLGFPVLVAGMLILVLAEIFNQGLQLEEDAKLTV